jgi:hypothetical protein
LGTLKINGERKTYETPDDMPPTWVIREERGAEPWLPANELSEGATRAQISRRTDAA